MNLNGLSTVVHNIDDLIILSSEVSPGGFSYTATGFEAANGDARANGDYEEVGTHNSKPIYRNSNGAYLWYGSPAWTGWNITDKDPRDYSSDNAVLGQCTYILSKIGADSPIGDGWASGGSYSVAGAAVAVYSGSSRKKFLSNQGEYEELVESDLPLTVGGISGLVRLSNGLIDSSYLPSYVDDVIDGYYHNGYFYPDPYYSGTAYERETGKIYVDLTHESDTNPYVEIYRWTGSNFISITKSNGQIDEAINTFISISGRLSSNYDTFNAISGKLSGGYNTLNSISGNLSSGYKSWNTISGKLSSGYDHFASLSSHIPTGDIEAGSPIDYLIFKVPEIEENPYLYYNLVIDFADNNTFNNYTRVTLTDSLSSFYRGDNTSKSYESLSTFTVGLPFQFSNDIIRYDMSSIKETYPDKKNLRYQWVASDYDSSSPTPNTTPASTTSSAFGFGMTNGLMQIFDVDTSSLANKIDVISARVEEIAGDTGGAGITPVIIANGVSTYTANANEWVMCFNNSVVVTLPTSSIDVGTLVKVTANSNALSSSIKGNIYGEGQTSWEQLATTSSPLVLDMPETLTFVYASSHWNLVEANRL